MDARWMSAAICSKHSINTAYPQQLLKPCTTLHFLATTKHCAGHITPLHGAKLQRNYPLLQHPRGTFIAVIYALLQQPLLLLSGVLLAVRQEPYFRGPFPHKEMHCSVTGTKPTCNDHMTDSGRGAAVRCDIAGTSFTTISTSPSWRVHGQ